MKYAIIAAALLLGACAYLDRDTLENDIGRALCHLPSGGYDADLYCATN